LVAVLGLPPRTIAPSVFRRARRRLYGDASLCLLILIGCTNGDFGRVRPSLVTEGIHAWVGRDAARGAGAPVSNFPLTDDELLLRDYAYQLIAPPYDLQRWYSVLSEWGMTHYFRPEWYSCDPTAYAERLMNSFFRSQISLYSRVDDDVRDDVVRISNFVPVARRVLDVDNKRQKSVGFVSALSGPELANAQARVGENALVIAWVQQSLLDRQAAYRFALERLIVVVPSPAAVTVERSLTLLQTRAAESVLVAPPQSFAVAAAAAPRPPIISK
jgi:hypothetical protein